MEIDGGLVELNGKQREFPEGRGQTGEKDKCSSEIFKILQDLPLIYHLMENSFFTSSI